MTERNFYTFFITHKLNIPYVRALMKRKFDEIGRVFGTTKSKVILCCQKNTNNLDYKLKLQYYDPRKY